MTHCTIFTIAHTSHGTAKMARVTPTLSGSICGGTPSRPPSIRRATRAPRPVPPRAKRRGSVSRQIRRCRGSMSTRARRPRPPRALRSRRTPIQQRPGSHRQAEVRRAPVDALRELATASCVSAVQSSRKHRVIVVGRRAVAQPHGHGEVEKEHLGVRHAGAPPTSRHASTHCRSSNGLWPARV